MDQISPMELNEIFQQSKCLDISILPPVYFSGQLWCLSVEQWAIKDPSLTTKMFLWVLILNRISLLCCHPSFCCWFGKPKSELIDKVVLNPWRFLDARITTQLLLIGAKCSCCSRDLGLLLSSVQYYVAYLWDDIIFTAISADPSIRLLKTLYSPNLIGLNPFSTSVSSDRRTQARKVRGASWLIKCAPSLSRPSSPSQRLRHNLHLPPSP